MQPQQLLEKANEALALRGLTPTWAYSNETRKYFYTVCLSDERKFEDEAIRNGALKILEQPEFLQALPRGVQEEIRAAGERVPMKVSDFLPKNRAPARGRGRGDAATVQSRGPEVENRRLLGSCSSSCWLRCILQCAWVLFCSNLSFHFLVSCFQGKVVVVGSSKPGSFSVSTFGFFTLFRLILKASSSMSFTRHRTRRETRHRTRRELDSIKSN